MTFRWTAQGAIGQCRGMIPALAALALTTGLLFTATPGIAGEITGLNLNGDELVLRFDAPVSGASALVLDGPRRIALDIDGVNAPRTAVSRASVNSARVANVRQGQYSSTTARIVLDLTEPAVLASARFSPDRRSLTVALRDVDAAGFSSAAARGRSPIATPDTALVPVIDFARPPRQTHSITVPIPAAGRPLALPRIYGPAEPGRPLVVIDAGHGGHDPGAINKESGKREKDITLAIARSIRDELVKSGRVRVALTREDDRFLVLQERYGIARKMNADLFISIHADSADTSEARGATIYTLSETASDREAARLAARENRADVINGVNLGGQSSDVSSILIDLTQRETMNVSADFAQLLQREASPYVAFRPGYHRFASLVVLKAPDMPSVLFETGYISNAQDTAKLSSAAGQRQIAQGVAKAIEVHFARRLAMN
ncbi:N-acetylmuramoyl-L-alanine amidase [Sphingobium subterraneum]|uniref:N-acetylmuramoyl-L-alanine amidase n=1 Tax=Sphingobium subterraneum TaxID=627688 RepID=A0A841J1G8_9SPHN|nr:N-acetylmuramoyl-L-alanine amidase [Sphingobium subterraneum]MBB6124783.1 N-acetylmuramoyl-L-alanine amidase [Sphingobium subterraneum]